MAIQTGFDVTVIQDALLPLPRDFRNKVGLDWPDIALDDISLDGETSLVALTHDPKIDDTALHQVLGKPLFHIACLAVGALMRRALNDCQRLGFLMQSGEDQRAGRAKYWSKTPAEIAVSVLGELAAAYRGRRCNEVVQFC